MFQTDSKVTTGWIILTNALCNVHYLYTISIMCPNVANFDVVDFSTVTVLDGAEYVCLNVKCHVRK